MQFKYGGRGEEEEAPKDRTIKGQGLKEAVPSDGGMPWRNCKCDLFYVPPQVDRVRVIPRLPKRVRERIRERQRLLHERARELRQSRTCPHSRCSRRDGVHDCGVYRDEIFNLILRCDDCWVCYVLPCRDMQRHHRS